MESDFRPDASSGSDGPPTSAQARAALDLLNSDGARLAERMVTPWWYHVVLGLITALFAGSLTLSGSAQTVVVALGVIAIPVLVTAYRRRYGISTSQPAGPASRRLLFLTFGVLILAMVANVAVKFTSAPLWWGVLPALLAFGATVVLGRRYDRALRGELARNADERA